MLHNISEIRQGTNLRSEISPELKIHLLAAVDMSRVQAVGRVSAHLIELVRIRIPACMDHRSSIDIIFEKYADHHCMRKLVKSG